MQSFKTNLLAGASALLLAVAFTAPASAANVNGGGSSLIAPYLAQAFDCNVTGVGQSLLWDTNAAAVTYQACPYSGSLTDTFQTATVGSGAGIKGFLTETAANLFAATATLPSGFTDVSFAVSDGPLTGSRTTVGSDIYAWENGTADTARGFSVTGTHARLLQFPLSIDPVAIAFNPVYDAQGDQLDIETNSGKLELTREAYCAIFNGDIHTWDDSRLTALNNGLTLTPGHTSVPMHLVGRSESSGTTQLFTRHLQVACDAEAALSHISHNFYTTVGGANFTPNGTGGVVGGPYTNSVSFTLVANSSGVSNAIAAQPGAIGYLGPDYTADFEAASGAPANGLPAAMLINFNDSTLYAASGSDATTAFGAQTLPSGATAQAEPSNWVPNATLANPAAGYPIIGTTNVILKTVYGSSSISTPIKSFMSWYYTVPVTGTSQSDDLLNAVGLAPLPNNWKSAIGTYAAANITP
ncbi:MAG TPA: substrate-binding domain-containing protein [Rhizomicrobium sp.]|jgi:ABC-type phosphate transport system substrate-binding protein